MILKMKMESSPKIDPLFLPRRDATSKETGTISELPVSSVRFFDVIWT